MMFMPLLLLGKNRLYMDTVATGKKMPSIKDASLISLNFCVVTFAWIFFRSDSFTNAVNYITQMFTMTGGSIDGLLLSMRMLLLLGFVTILFVFEWMQREHVHGLSVVPKNSMLRHLLYFSIFFIIMWFGGAQADFIYFQF